MDLKPLNRDADPYSDSSALSDGLMTHELPEPFFAVAYHDEYTISSAYVHETPKGKALTLFVVSLREP